MKLRTAIVEDQKPDAERLEQLLKKAFGEEEILCRRFVCGDDFLKEFPGEGYQVVFLDICMMMTPRLHTRKSGWVISCSCTCAKFAAARHSPSAICSGRCEPGEEERL